MADKRLDQVTKVTDMAYVPVIMSDGSIGQIAKADLATVVAGVLNKSKGVISDCNSVTTSGFYSTNQETLNQPEGGSFGFVNVISLGTYIIQEYRSISSDKIQAFRVVTTTNMSSWQRVDNFGCNSLEELAAALKPLM